MDAAVGRPRILASRADGRAGVSPRTSGGEGGEGRGERGRRRGLDAAARGRAVGRGGRAEARRCGDQRPAIVALCGRTSGG